MICVMIGTWIARGARSTHQRAQVYHHIIGLLGCIWMLYHGTSLAIVLCCGIATSLPHVWVWVAT